MADKIRLLGKAYDHLFASKESLYEYLIASRENQYADQVCWVEFLLNGTVKSEIKAVFRTERTTEQQIRLFRYSKCRIVRNDTVHDVEAIGPEMGESEYAAHVKHLFPDVWGFSIIWHEASNPVASSPHLYSLYDLVKQSIECELNLLGSMLVRSTAERKQRGLNLYTTKPAPVDVKDVPEIIRIVQRVHEKGYVFPMIVWHNTEHRSNSRTFVSVDGKVVVNPYLKDTPTLLIPENERIEYKEPESYLHPTNQTGLVAITRNVNLYQLALFVVDLYIDSNNNQTNGTRFGQGLNRLTEKTSGVLSRAVLVQSLKDFIENRHRAIITPYKKKAAEKALEIVVEIFNSFSPDLSDNIEKTNEQTDELVINETQAIADQFVPSQLSDYVDEDVLGDIGPFSQPKEKEDDEEEEDSLGDIESPRYVPSTPYQ